MKDNVGIFLGRFQPFHKGHEITIRRMLEMHDHVKIIIGSADKHGTARNPFHAQIRANIIDRWIFDNGFQDRITFHFLSDLTNESDNSLEWGKKLYDAITSVIDFYQATTEGKNFTIHYSDSLAIIDKWFETGNLPPRLEWYIQNRHRNQNGVSATMIREAILRGKKKDRKFLGENLPPQTLKQVPLLREILQKIK